MRNTILIDTTKHCDCQCVSSTDDKTNSILMVFTVGDVQDAKVYLRVDGNLMSINELTPNTDNTAIIPEKYFATATTIEVGYSDHTHASDIFTFTFSGERKGEMMVCKIDNFNYTVSFKVAGSGGGGTPYTLPPATKNTLGGVIVGNGLDVAENGLLNVSESFFVSVSNGKAQIAAAITDKGVETAADDTFSHMATNISLISSGGGVTYDSLTNDGKLVEYTLIEG